MWCLPFAGGGAAIWHGWARPLAGLAEIVALRPPGRENRHAEQPFIALADLVPALVEQLAPYVNEDYVLCGHSLGGLAAFEVARALRTRGLNLPQALIVCGVRAPHHGPDLPLLHRLPHADFIAGVERRYGAIPREIREHPEFLDLLLPVLRADLEVFETYAHAPAPPLHVPILALGGENDHIVSRSQLLGWRAHTSAYFEAEMIPGGHFFPQDNPVETTRRVRAFLSRLAVSYGSAAVVSEKRTPPVEPATHARLARFEVERVFPNAVRANGNRTAR
jgi:medium-chain acyl-[acyl-carrier-protein] hydrolase